MGVGLHEKFRIGSFKLSRERSDTSCLSFSSSPIEEEDEATDVKPELLLTKHRQKNVTFCDRVVVVPIHRYSSEEKSTSFMSGEELLPFDTRYEHWCYKPKMIVWLIVTLLVWKIMMKTSGDWRSTCIQEKYESASRKERAFQAVFKSQQKCYDEELVASEYARITVEASERALQLGLIDQERAAWSSDEIESSTLAPRKEAMDR